MDTKNSSGNSFGPDQRNNPQSGQNRHQWEESGAGDGSGTTSLGSANEGNSQKLAPDEQDTSDDFTTNGIDGTNEED